MSAAVETVPGIDATWLEATAPAEPTRHAYARWDLRQRDPRARFVSVHVAGRPVGYLLVWGADPARPIVHWVGPIEMTRILLGSLPARPLVVVAPPETAKVVEQSRGPAIAYPGSSMVHDSQTLVTRPGVRGSARRLRSTDRGELARLLAPEHSLLSSGYDVNALDSAPVFGSFVGEDLVAVGRASVTLPDVWVLSGIYTRPDQRGAGHAGAVVDAATRSAHAAGADAILFVRDDNPGARRVYERCGYRVGVPLVWLDLGAGFEP